MPQTDYQRRRTELAKKLPKGAIVIIPAASECLRNGDVHYRFRQDSDFYYLTGFTEPDALLIILAGSHPETILFNKPRHPAEEQWTGKRLGQEAACDALDIDVAYSLEQVDQRLPELLADKQSIYYPLGRHPHWSKRVLQAWKIVKGQSRRGIGAPVSFCDVAPFLSEMRVIKSETEIALMREAARISVAAHERAMQRCYGVTHEHELEAEILYELMRQGCRSVAYDSIVAGGENACILHYTDNNKRLNPGDLVLIDAAGEYQHYAADITRTYPVDGHFSAEQRAIYELVLCAQQAGIACIHPGSPWNSAQEAIVRVLTAGLVDLGLLRGEVDGLIVKGAYKPFYMHQSGHWLGLDVHDVGQYKINGQWRSLEPGMVLTVEPGLYIQPGLEGVDPKWWTIGVRIEDDILVTDDGHDNLTSALAVAVDDIEAMVRG